MGRKCINWLHTYAEYITHTETPRHFWLWGGLLTLAAVLERKVYLPFMRGGIFPNLFVLLIAPPGKCRKGEPIKLCKRMLHDVDVSVYADSGTRRAVTNTLAELSKMQSFEVPPNRVIQHSSMAIVSAEFSTFLMANMKEMIELLTDLWDCPEMMKHGTYGCGEDKIQNVYMNGFFATTPIWMSENLPQVLQGGGFLSRVIPLSADRKHQWLADPPKPSGAVYKKLLADLKHIGKLLGTFRWDKDAHAFYTDWYTGLEVKIDLEKDERVCGYMERFHIQMLKVAMLLRISYSDDLVLTVQDLETAIGLMESVIAYLPKTLSGHGRNRYTADIESVMVQLKEAGEMKFSELMALNYMNCGKAAMDEILQTLEAMHRIVVVQAADKIIRWKGKRS